MMNGKKAYSVWQGMYFPGSNKVGEAAAASPSMGGTVAYPKEESLPTGTTMAPGDIVHGSDDTSRQIDQDFFHG